MNTFENSFFDLIASRTKLQERRSKIRYQCGELVTYKNGVYESLGNNNPFNPINSNFWRKIL